MASTLIVDGVAENREASVTVLRAHGHTLLEAVNSGDGVAIAVVHPNLAITDGHRFVTNGGICVRQRSLERERADLARREGAGTGHSAAGIPPK